VLAVIVVATIGKVFGTTLFYMLGRQPWREGMVVGAGMNGRGAVEIIVAEIALVAGIIDQDVFSILVFMAIITTALVPIMLTKGVEWLRQRGELVKAGDREGAIIVGAGPVARELGQILAESEPVTLVDTNRGQPGGGTPAGMKPVFGSALEEQTLLTAGVERAATVIALTPNNEVNVLTAQLAAGHGVPEVAVLVKDAQASSFESLLGDNGVARLFPGELDLLTWDYELASGGPRARRSRFRRRTDRLDRATQDVLPLAVVRTGDVLPFTGDIEPGDRVILISTQRARAGAEV
jgi:voltage-gated potassium channel Kch